MATPCQRIIALSATAPNIADIAAWLKGTLFELTDICTKLAIPYNIRLP
jgi:replicative superfamily II helicase